MADELFTIPPDILPGDIGPRDPPANLVGRVMRMLAPPRRPNLTAQWLDAEGARLGGEVRLDPPASDWIEYPGADGQMGHERVSRGLAFEGEQPAAAAHLEVLDGGRRIARMPTARVARAASTLPSPMRKRIGPDTARLAIPVFSERFADQPTFLASVEQLRAWILSEPPFNEAAVGANLAFDSHFWPSNTVTGLFDTPDSNSQGERLFHGDRVRAKRLLDSFIGGAKTSLILINSTARGGAGGVPGYSTWSSIAPRVTEPWQAVCLHELGHGLGLADEYCDARREKENPEGEPNVSRKSKPSEAPWHALVTLGDQDAPSFTLANEAQSPPNAVGTFQGARYRKDLYRPSRQCLMRDTRESFCAVCCAHLSRIATGSS